MNAPKSGELILLVDDDLLNLELAQSVLEAAGYRVVSAMNGQDGLAAFDSYRHQIKLVITDNHMPVLTGVEMVGQIRQLAPDVTVLAVTGQELTEAQASFGPTGVRNFLKKPYLPRQLLSVVTTLTGGENAR